MKSMKILVVVIILLIVLPFLSFIMIYLSPGNFFYNILQIKKKLKVSVAVIEGVVEVRDLDYGLLKVIESGDAFSQVTIVETPMFQTMFFVPLIKPLVPQTVNIYKVEMARITEPAKEHWIFKRVYTEEEFDEFIIRKLRKDPRVTDATVTFSPEGFEAKGRVRVGDSYIAGTITGIVKVRNDKFILELFDIKAANLKVSNLIKRELEDVFNNAVSAADTKIAAKEVKFVEGGMEITFLRKDRYTLKNPSYSDLPENFYALDNVEDAKSDELKELETVLGEYTTETEGEDQYTAEELVRQLSSAVDE